MVKDKTLIAKFIVGFLFVVAWIVLILIKNQKPETSLKIAFIVTGILTGIFIIWALNSIISKEIKKLKKKIKKEEAISEEEANQIVINCVNYLMNNIKKMYVEKSHTYNKNLIYAFRVKLDIKEYFGDDIYVLINATNPKEKPQIKNATTISPHDLERDMNRMAMNPEAEPNITKTKETLDQFKNPIRETEQITQNIKKEEEKEEESVV